MITISTVQERSYIGPIKTFVAIHTSLQVKIIRGTQAMAKKQTNSSVTSANIAAAAAAALSEEKAILFTKRIPVAKKHAKANVSSVSAEPVTNESTAKLAIEQPVLIEEIVMVQATPIVSQTAHPDRAKIALLAYQYWEARGYQGGPEEEKRDWLRAEAELSS